MHVAKYWRNNKLRYRMVRMAELGGEKAPAAEPKTRNASRIPEPRERRVKVAS